MSQANNQDAQRAGLANQLKQIDELWQKLLHVEWNPASFAALEHLAQNMVQLARGYGEERVLKLVAQLAHHLNSCLATNIIPHEADRQRLAAFIDALYDALATGNGRPKPGDMLSFPRLSAAPLEIAFIAPDAAVLAAKLDEPRYRVRFISGLAEAERSLRAHPPSAIILDLDFLDSPEQAHALLGSLRDQPNPPPLLVCSERNDLVGRLAAVREGAAAYLSKPIDRDELCSVLAELLLPEIAQTAYRILIVNDQPSEAWEIAGILEEQGMAPRVVTQPSQTLREINHFNPDLLIIDLDIQEIPGAELAQVIAQHRSWDLLPLVLLCTEAGLPHYLENLDAPGATLLAKPIPAGYLCWGIKQCLRRLRTVRVKLNALASSDSISGFHNRQRFLILLEQALDMIGLRNRSVAVMFIMLDNLQSVRDAAGVAVADEIVRQAAARLYQVLAQDQQAARFGDAAFAVMIPDQLGESLLALAHQIRDALEAGYYKSEAQALLVQVHIGVAVATDRYQDHLLLVQHAETASGMARETGGERIYAHQNALVNKRDPEISSRTRMLDQVEEVFAQERLWLVYQPIVSVRGDPVERYEVLLRLRDQDKQEIPPSSVFGVVHSHPLGLQLDRWIITQAIEVLRQRRPPIKLFIKVLPVTLQDRTLSEWLGGQLAQAGVAAEQIVFEVAEATAERSLRDVFGFLGGIKLLGCGFCLDHFGRGADSLGLLKNLNADYVKLDMHLVNGLVDDSVKQAELFELMHSLQTLGIAAIVGGVEDIKVLPVLWSLGVDLIQGFFLQQPYREMSYDFANSAF